MSVPGRWPLRTFIEFGAQPGAVPCARLHARQVLWEWQQTGLTDAAELVVSELMTNAVAATKAIASLCPVKLWLLSDKSQTLILVADANPHPPKRIDPEATTEAGRGLLLVEAITSDWGWYPVHTSGMAKVVWAEIRA